MASTRVVAPSRLRLHSRRDWLAWIVGSAIVGIVPACSPGSRVGDDTTIQVLYRERRSDVFVEGAGKVARILPDDLRGARHQRLIVELGSGHTLLVSHNIDIAPRIEALSIGDSISFRGEYEWNQRGGVLHWTHHDPGRNRAGGWIEHRGITYR